MSPDRREHRRYSAQDISIWFQSTDPDGISGKHTLLDVSLGGMFIETDFRPRCGTRLKLKIDGDGRRKPIQIDGRVAWVADSTTTNHKPGIGIKLKANGRPSRIASLIEGLEPNRAESEECTIPEPSNVSVDGVSSPDWPSTFPPPDITEPPDQFLQTGEELVRVINRLSEEHRALLGQVEELRCLRFKDAAQREAASARAEELEKARERAEDERKLLQARLDTSEKEREAVRARAAELDALRQRERAEKLAAQAKERSLAEKHEMRNEIALLLESAQQLRSVLDSNFRSPVLDADTQKARRNLVSVSAFALLLSAGPLRASELNILGLKFAQLNATTISTWVAIAVLYLEFAFALKAWDTLQLWRKGVNEALNRLKQLANDTRLSDWEKELPENVALVRGQTEKLPEPTSGLSASTVADLGMPLVLGLVAIAVCIVRAAGASSGG